jgi:hypothetical protein
MEKLEAIRQGSGVLLVFCLCRLRTDRCSSLFVMLNACLTFSWLNKVSFDREASDTIRVGINSDWQTGAEGGMTGTRRVSPRCVLAVGRSLGSAVHDCYPVATWKVSLVICSSLDR